MNVDFGCKELIERGEGIGLYLLFVFHVSGEGLVVPLVGIVVPFFGCGFKFVLCPRGG